MPRKRRSGSHWLGIGACLAAGCGRPVEPAGAVATGELEAATSSTSSTSEDASLDLGTLEDEAPSRQGGVFLQPTDAGGHRECDTWSQDCPAGEKCTVWANDGGGSWNSTKCEPVAPDPDRVDEPCTVVGNGVSGIDSCELGSMCWNVDPETSLGLCVEFCGGSEANPTCSNPTYHCIGREPVLCMPSCCPLEQSCGSYEGCYPSLDTFGCIPDAGGEHGSFGEPCEFINVCDPGLFCADADRVPDCGGSLGCCTAYCEIGSSTCEALHPDLECTPWFEQGQNPLESHVGGCMLPQE